MNILFTESSPNIGGQELQTVAQMVAIRKKGILSYWFAGKKVK